MSPHTGLKEPSSPYTGLGKPLSLHIDLREPLSLPIKSLNTLAKKLYYEIVLIKEAQPKKKINGNIGE